MLGTILLRGAAPARHLKTTLATIPRSMFHVSNFRQNEHIFTVQDEDDFEKRVKKNKTPVIIDFHATWCGPCKVLGPRIETLVGQQSGDVLLAKVDIDQLQDLAIDFGVEAVPTVVAMKNGIIVDKFIGIKDDDEIKSFIRTLTKK